MKKPISKNLKGFTLIELVIVLGVIAVLGTTALATARSMQRRTLYTAARTLQADMRKAQRMAVIEGRRWGVRFSMDYGRYDVYSTPRWDADHFYRIYLPSGVEFQSLGRTTMEYLPRGTVGGQTFAVGRGTAFTLELRNGSYVQRMTVNVSGGRVELDGPVARIPRPR